MGLAVLADSCILVSMFKLTVEKRDTKNDLKTLRAEGKLPAVFYGGKTESTPISMNTAEFKKIWKEAGESSVVTINNEGKDVDVLIHEVAQHPVTDEPIHVDFYTIDKTKKVTVNIPIEFIGEAPAVKNLDGVLVKVLHELEIEGLPTKLPHNIEVDLELLVNLDSHISIKDIILPEDVSFTADPKETVVSITTQKEEEEEAPVEVDFESIEVEQKGKKEEEGGEESTTEESKE